MNCTIAIGLGLLLALLLGITGYYYYNLAQEADRELVGALQEIEQTYER